MDNKKIILVNLPPTLYYNYNKKGGIYPSSAIILIGTLLKKNGYSVEIIDCAFEEEYLHLLKKSLRSTQEVLFVGISVMTSQIPMALEASVLIKKSNRTIPVIWGGVHPTLFPEQTLANENIDIIAINEGAFTCVELAKKLENNGDLNSINGIGYKDESGHHIFTPPRKVEDINELPYFDFSLLNIHNYTDPNVTSTYQREFPYLNEKLRLFPILTGLGCAYRCEFCINVILKRRYRYRSAESIINEIKRLKRDYDANSFLFLDEDFFINKKRVLKFLSLIEKEDLHFNWRMWCRVDHFRTNYIDQDLIKRLAAIGNGSLVMGGESANQEILDYLKKGTTSQQIIRSLQVISETSIFPRYSFMVGLENETIDQIKNTYNFCLTLKKINPLTDIAGPFVFRLYAGSPIFNRLVAKYNLKLPKTLELWAEYIKKEETFTEMPWTPKRFNKITKFLNFYSTIALSSLENKNQKITKKSLFGLFARIRIRYFFFKFPIEFWISNLLKKFRDS